MRRKLGKQTLIDTVLLICGVKPIFDRKQSNWCKKVSLVGTCCLVAQIGLLVYAYEIESTLTRIHRMTNNIMRSGVSVKRASALVLPLLYTYGRVKHWKWTELFYAKLDIFDNFMRTNQWSRHLQFNLHPDQLWQTEDLGRRKANVIFLVLALINIVTSIMYLNVSTQKHTFWPIYFYQMTLSCFSAQCLEIALCFNKILIRIEQYNEILKKILALVITAEKQKMIGQKYKL